MELNFIIVADRSTNLKKKKSYNKFFHKLAKVKIPVACCLKALSFLSFELV